jgi:hypothetical protein
MRPDVRPAYRRTRAAEVRCPVVRAPTTHKLGVTPFTSRLPRGNMAANVRGEGDPRAGVAGATRHEGGSNGAARVLRGPDACSRGVARRIAPATPTQAAGPARRRVTVAAGSAGVAKTNDAAPLRTGDAASMTPVEAQLVVLRPHGPAFSLAQSSPDPVRLTDAQCIPETRLSHGTCGANGFGLLFSLELLALALEVRRWEEDDRLRATTCSSNLPVLLNTLCAHRHTPLPRRTIQPLPGPNQRKVPSMEESRDRDAYQVSGVVNAV